MEAKLYWKVSQHAQRQDADLADVWIVSPGSKHVDFATFYEKSMAVERFGSPGSCVTPVSLPDGDSLVADLD